MANTQVFIDGDQGTTGLQIRERLSGRTDIDVVTLPAERRKDVGHRRAALNDCDIAILCLPDDAAREAVGLIERPDVRVIDASSAHRTHPDWTYGLPELERAQAGRIARARRISNPGCYPTGAIALLRPVIRAGLLSASHPTVVHAVSGYSGGGRAAVQRHTCARAGEVPAFQVYGLGLRHKHVPEIQRHAGLELPPVFVPSYGNFAQGIVLTIPLHRALLAHGVQGGALRDALAEAYAGAAHVTVLSRTQSEALTHLDPEALNGTDRLQLAVLDNGEDILLTAVFDNLGKGAAGAAVQNLDLLLGQAGGPA